MSSFKESYYIEYDRNRSYYVPNVPFTLGEVEPYYDLYEDGTIMLYIKKESKRFFGLTTHTEILKVKDSNIKVFVHEIPERRECGKE